MQNVQLAGQFWFVDAGVRRVISGEDPPEERLQ
jgi:hypothetical protein